MKVKFGTMVWDYVKIDQQKAPSIEPWESEKHFLKIDVNGKNPDAHVISKVNEKTFETAVSTCKGIIPLLHYLFRLIIWKGDLVGSSH